MNARPEPVFKHFSNARASVRCESVLGDNQLPWLELVRVTDRPSLCVLHALIQVLGDARCSASSMAEDFNDVNVVHGGRLVGFRFSMHIRGAEAFRRTEAAKSPCDSRRLLLSGPPDEAAKSVSSWRLRSLVEAAGIEPACRQDSGRASRCLAARLFWCWRHHAAHAANTILGCVSCRTLRRGLAPACECFALRTCKLGAQRARSTI
jgi:hypothetical protein